MSMSYETFREGSETNGGASIAGGTTLQLTDAKLWIVLTATGGAGDVVLKLPFAKGLQLGTVFRFLFLVASDQNTVIRNFTTGTDLTIFDATGVARTSIDFDTLKWGAIAGVEALLTVNTTGDGGWILYSA